MPDAQVLKQGTSQAPDESQTAPAVFLGSYMPFAGVTYYVMLDEQEFHEGKNKVGPVGWRLARTSSEVTARAPVPLPDRESHVLRQVDIFVDLDDEQIKKIASLGSRVRVPSNWTMGITGEVSSRLFIIIQGKAELFAHSSIGEITVRTVGAGESFPLSALIGSGTLITSATAMTDMKLLAIPRSRLLALCHEDSDIGMRLYSAIAGILADRYCKTLNHLTTNAEKALRQAGYFANV